MKHLRADARRARGVAAAGAAAFIFASPAAAPADTAPHSGQPKAGEANVLTKLLAPRIAPTSGRPEDDGAFGPPMTEPNIGDRQTDAKCLDGADPSGLKRCKPAAGANVLLPNGKLLYWNNLGGTENVNFQIVGEYGAVSTNDEARVLDLGAGNATPAWALPSPVDGGANPNGERASEPLIPGGETTETFNDGALFGSHQSFLPDGRVLIQGGTDYSLDPGVNGLPFGVTELSGLRATRIFDPKTNTFTRTGDTSKGRWYPTQVSLGNGETLVFGGVGKLIKPIYRKDLTQSGQNVLTTERYDPATGKWTDEGARAKQDLPLYPRMHLLPNGKVFFNASGQSFNPNGQSLGQAGWINQKIYDPRAKSWRDVGIPGLTDAKGAPSLFPGFRGSMSSTMMPLEPNQDGNYTKASFLTAGGVLALSPGSYIPVADSRITTVDTSQKRERTETRTTGPLAGTRWFGQQVLLPTGDVMQFSGGDKDEVVGPGTEFPRQQAEIFDPKTEEWSPAAVAARPRTYHNTGVLLPSGEVLIGGHATISTLYLNNTTLPGGFAPHDGRDPSFEVYKPPYLFRGTRPVIQQAGGSMGYGDTFDVKLASGTSAEEIDSVRLVRNTAITHVIDADQRQVVLPVVKRAGQTLTVKSPPSGDVAPAGPYMLFVNGKSDKGAVPSEAKLLMVGGSSTAIAKQCVSRRAFTIHVKRRFRNKLRSAEVTLNGKRVRSLKGRRSSAPITLKGLPKGVVTVRITMRTKSGKKVVDERRYRTCAPKRKRR